MIIKLVMAAGVLAKQQPSTTLVQLQDGWDDSYVSEAMVVQSNAVKEHELELEDKNAA